MMREDTFSIGIDVGGTKAAYGLFDHTGKLTDRMQHAADKDADGPRFADQMISSVEELLLKNHLTKQQLVGVGVGMPSYVLYDEGYIYLTSALPKIQKFHLRDYMQERLQVRVVLDNDANAAALAEHRHGAGRGTDHMVYLTVSTGLGSGIIINGQVFRGSYGFAGECGHMLLTPDEGLACGCGNRGCFMSYGSGRYIPDHIRNRIAAGTPSILSQVDQDTLSCVDLLAACRKDDPLAMEMLGQMAQTIGVCAFNVYQMMNIKTFVFGGGLTAFGPLLFDRVAEVFKRYDHIGLPVDFRFAELGSDFGIIGASELVR